MNDKQDAKRMRKDRAARRAKYPLNPNSENEFGNMSEENLDALRHHAGGKASRGRAVSGGLPDTNRRRH